MMKSGPVCPTLFREDLIFWSEIQTFFRRSADIVEVVSETLPGVEQIACDCLAVDLESLDPTRNKGRLASNFPVHFMLYQLAQREYLSDTRKFLALHICSHAYEFFRRPGRNSDSSPNRFEEVCRATRSMSDRELECFAPPFPKTRVQLHEAVMCLTKRDAQVTTAVHDRLVAFRTFLHFISNYRPRDSHKRKKRTFKSRELGNFQDNDTDAHPIQERVIKIRPKEEKALTPEEHLSAAGSNFESYSGSTFRQLNEPAPANGSESMRRLRVHQTDLHRKRGNILQPHRWDVLSETEIANLVKHVSDAPSEAGLAVMLCLVTGRDLECVLNAGMSGGRSRSKDIQLWLNPKGRFWRAQISLPESRRKIQSQWRHYLEPGENVIEMPLPQAVSALFIALGKNNLSGRLFSLSDGQIIKDNIKILLSEVNAKFAGRLTLLRISRSLFNAIAGTGDTADAFLVTTSSPPFGQTASVFYYRTTVAHLRVVYRRAMGRLMSGASGLGDFEQAGQGDLIDRWVGTEFKLRFDLLQVLVRDLIGNTEQARKHSDWRDFHNHFTSYCVLFLAFTTGHRAITNPLESASDIDWQRGFVVIDDKAGSGDRARLVPIIKPLEQQLSAYLDYRERIQIRLKKRPDSVFFYLDDELKPEVVAPANLAAHIRYATDLPLNMNRHFLRSELRRSGVSGPTVDYFMGHWDDGQEPFAHYSTLSPRAYREELSGPLTEIAEKAGWKPILRLL